MSTFDVLINMKSYGLNSMAPFSTSVILKWVSCLKLISKCSDAMKSKDLN